MSEEPGLFDVELVPPHPVVKTTPGERRRARHLEVIGLGQHPLSTAGQMMSLPLHPQARRDGDRTDDGSPRCGTCRHRRSRNTGTAQDYPKCHQRGQERVNVVDGREYRWMHYPFATNGEATDCAAWWPACIAYEPA